MFPRNYIVEFKISDGKGAKFVSLCVLMFLFYVPMRRVHDRNSYWSHGILYFWGRFEKGSLPNNASNRTVQFPSQPSWYQIKCHKYPAVFQHRGSQSWLPAERFPIFFTKHRANRAKTLGVSQGKVSTSTRSSSTRNAKTSERFCEIQSQKTFSSAVISFQFCQSDCLLIFSDQLAFRRIPEKSVISKLSITYYPKTILHQRWIS